MIVGPHSMKLPQSWDTGSDQPSVPAISISICMLQDSVPDGSLQRFNFV